ncbi:YjeO family protein [Enterobacter asburiae]|nr:YjeO family protein [Enterobacter asburiae]
MRWKGFTLGFIWFWLSIFLILLVSTQDKEWLIDGVDITNICDLMISIASDDIRDIGLAVTVPLFFPFFYLMAWKRQHHWFQYLLFIAIFAFWLWRFFLRYTVCE